MQLFTYGTLMFPEVWKRISVGQLPSEPATLHGYACYRVRDAVYPGIIQSEENSLVPGLVYRDLDEETLFELDTYESDFYKRLPVQVVTEDGEKIDCQAYVVPELRREMLTDEPWDPEWFHQHELQKYLYGEI